MLWWICGTPCPQAHVSLHALTAPPCLADSDRLEHQLEEAVLLQQDYESSASKLKMLEKQVKMLRQEKDDIHKVVSLQRQAPRPPAAAAAGALKLCSCVSSSWPSLWSGSGASPRS